MIICCLITCLFIYLFIRDHLEAQKNSLEKIETKTHLNTEIKYCSASTEAKLPMTETKLSITETNNKHYLTLEPSLNTPTIIMSSTTPPAVSPVTTNNLPLPGASTSGSSSPVGSPGINNASSHPLLTTRRDSTTQVINK